MDRGDSLATRPGIIRCIVVLLPLIAACVRDASGPASPGPTGSPDAAVEPQPVQECPPEATGACARKFGAVEVSGKCVRGWCITDGPGCIRDDDCQAGGECLTRFCKDGQCEALPASGPCPLEDSEGICHLGVCENPNLLRGQTCTWLDAGVPVDGGVAADAGLAEPCPDPENPCLFPTCRAGRCDYAPRQDGEECRTGAGGPGKCAAGRCRLDGERAVLAEKTCRKVKRRRFNYWMGYHTRQEKKCRTSLRYRIDADELATQRKKLQEGVAKGVHYDVAAGLVALPDGGYNIIVVNTRGRDDIRGLVDPSFVAFHLGGFTSKTNWKSRRLQIWLDGLEEGWGLPTSGGRRALRKGKQASALGWLGVVDVSAYRKWLEAAFMPLPAGSPVPGVVVKASVSGGAPGPSAPVPVDLGPAVP